MAPSAKESHSQQPGQHKITPRNVQFGFGEELPTDWHSGEPGISRFYDALSLTFPEGERFFMDSVRAFADRIEDPKLQEDVRGFLAQEAIHSREHAAYNKLTKAHGIETAPIENAVRFGLTKIARKLPKRAQLAITCALEHYTALFAEVILSDPRVMEGAHPLYADLWRWHALEEEEHKAVAFDVYQTVAPGFGGYLRRCVTMTFATIDFNLGTLFGQTYLMAKSGNLFNARAWGRSLYYLWIKPGVWRRVLAGVPRYYRPSFHPWQHDRGAIMNRWAGSYRAPDGARTDDGAPLFGPNAD